MSFPRVLRLAMAAAGLSTGLAVQVQTEKNWPWDIFDHVTAANLSEAAQEDAFSFDMQNANGKEELDSMSMLNESGQVFSIHLNSEMQLSAQLSRLNRSK
eukprot:TRINITY_DN15429_c0_g1_i1.p1 TRINITY_DN15429_c0_g1~~TRINITY_DN15429_c0_g1_i1.p1  ORF type:complete len:100 (-),score=19.64 TRINITY_DN15429_c0_g1_i1:8-307(-)